MTWSTVNFSRGTVFHGSSWHSSSSIHSSHDNISEAHMNGHISIHSCTCSQSFISVLFINPWAAIPPTPESFFHRDHRYAQWVSECVYVCVRACVFFLLHFIDIQHVPLQVILHALVLLLIHWIHYINLNWIQSFTLIVFCVLLIVLVIYNTTRSVYRSLLSWWKL